MIDPLKEIVRLNSDGFYEILNLETGELIVQDNISKETQRVKYSPHISHIIAQHIRDGKTMPEISSMEGMPSAAVIYKWKNMYPDFKLLLEEARKDRADIYHSNVMDIAREAKSLNYNKDEVTCARLASDLYKWGAEKDNPKEFGKENGGPEVKGGVTIIIDTGIRRDPITVEVVQEKVEAKVVSSDEEDADYRDISSEEHPSSPESLSLVEK